MRNGTVDIIKLREAIEAEHGQIDLDDDELAELVSHRKRLYESLASPTELRKAVFGMLGALREDVQPIVNVPKQARPIIHVHVPKIRKTTTTVERDADDNITQTITIYHYEEE